LSGKIVDLFQTYEAVFFSFGIVAFSGTVLTFFINEKKTEKGKVSVTRYVS